MKKNIHLLTIILFLLSAWACQEKKEKFGTIDLDNPGSAQNLNFSQLAGNIRCIPLETLPDFILSENDLRLWVSDKYIVTLCENDIRQFSPEGKFIRKLASAGKGPDEYIDIISYTVDEQSDILYYGHEGDYNNICAISLRDGQPIGKINTACLPKEMSVVDGNILCLPMKFQSERNLDIFTITPSGKIIDSIPVLPSASDRKPTLLPGKEAGHYMLLNDTVFRIDFPKLQAMAAVQNSRAMNQRDMKGYVYKILLKTPELFITRRDHVEMNRTNSGSIDTKITENSILLTNAHTFESTRADKFDLDTLGQELSYLPSIDVSGKKLFYVMSAFQIKNLAKEKRETGQALSPALQQLDGQLTEDSNPVIIVGDLK